MSKERMESLGAAIFVASSKGEIETLRRLITSNTEEQSTLIDFQDEDGWTPLMKAAESNFQQVVEVLCASGANVNHQNKDGYTPLIVAAVEGHINIIKYLVTHGAEMNKQDMNGSTALLWSCRSNAFSAQTLIQLGADVNAGDKDGLTPLMAAVCNDQVETVRQLIEQGANVNATNSDGCSALMAAIEDRNVPLSEMLIRAGAEYAVVGPRKPSFVVSINGERKDVIKLLEGLLATDTRDTAGDRKRTGLPAPVAGERASLRALIDEYIDSQQQIRTVQQRMTALESSSSELELLKQKLSELEHERDGLYDELRDVKEELAYAEEESSFMGKELANAKISIEELKMRNSKLASKRGNSSKGNNDGAVSTNLVNGILCRVEPV